MKRRQCSQGQEEIQLIRMGKWVWVRARVGVRDKVGDKL